MQKNVIFKIGKNAFWDAKMAPKWSKHLSQILQKSTPKIDGEKDQKNTENHPKMEVLKP